MIESLKFCPFCGGKVRLESSHGFNYVLCENCESEYYPASFGDVKKGVAAWNNRPIEDEFAEKIKKLEKENAQMQMTLEVITRGYHNRDDMMRIAKKALKGGVK